MANRGFVTLKVLPDALSELTQFSFSISLPLFVVIFASIAAGLMIGFVWEWLREHKHRADKSRAEKELRNTKREMRRMQGGESKSKDEVLSILEY